MQIGRFVLLSGLLFLISCSKGNSGGGSLCRTEMPTAVDTAIETALAAHPDTAGIVVSIYHPDLGYLHKAYGLEKRAGSVPMREDRIFDIGSVMKSFRWTVLHKLATQGTLDLTDAVNVHVASPVLPGRTFKHLMQHSSGMIDINDSLFMADVMANLTREYDYDDMITFLTTSSGAGFTNGLADGFAVGTDYRYSSFGPLLASEAAAAVTGKSMRTLIEEEIIAELNLSNTSYIWFDERPFKVAQGYDDATTEMNDMADYENTAGISSGFGGAMYSSACDLARYTNNLFNNDSFLPTTVMLDATNSPVTAGGIEVGLGVFRYASWGNFWGHLGSSIHGHSSAIAHRHSDKLSVVVLSNIDDGHDNYATHFSVISAIGAAL